MRCFYHPDYFFPLPEGHPFPMEKFPDAHAIIRKQMPDLPVEKIEPAPRKTLERIHTPEYLNSIEQGTLTPYDRNRLGLPHRPNLLQRSALETAGTIAAARHAFANGGFSANLAGGTHHAFPNRGLGFCVLNDVAVAIADLRHETGEPLHFMVIDTDAHQGNGTHFIFRGDPFVFTFSIHVGRNYPAKKEPGDCDVGLPRHVSGEHYLNALFSSLDTQLEIAEPDFIFWIAGADIHADDRFGQMQLSDADIAARDLHIIHLCHKWHIPTAVLYGGGYNRTPGKTGAIHAGTVLRTAKIDHPITPT